MATADAMNASIPPAPLPIIGDVVVDKYRIERLIAEGGMGVVFEATHIQLDERVAIKFLKSDLTGTLASELAGRFIREARASAKIRSEHVTRVHDVGTLPNGAPYIVMEKLTGLDLEQLVEKEGVMPLDQAVDYVLQACEALAEAHAIGIVHRDLKPANLFLTHRVDGSSCVKVLDFGISKFKDAPGADSKMGITKTHAVMGSPRYMSPEQMRSTKDVDARADQWAIGIILYELFAGTVPFDGESMPQICASILQDEPKPLRLLRPEITAELDAIVLRCLAKKAVDRYDSIAPLAYELSAYGSPAARASAERIARVLNAAEFNADTMPHDFPVSMRPSADGSGRLPSVRIHNPGPNASAGSATAVAWTGTDPALPQKRRRTIVLLALGAATASLIIVAGIFLHGRTTTDVATAAATVANAPAATTPTSTAIAPEAPVALAASSVAANASASPIADPDSSADAKLAAGSKKAPPAHPQTPPHGAITHASTSGASTLSAAQPPAAASTSAAGADMWGGRK